MAETSMREGFHEVAQQVRPSEINPKLEEAVQSNTLLPHLLSFRVVAMAVGIAAVVALALFLIASPMIAGVGLLLFFFASWFGLAARESGKADAARESDRESG